MRSPTFPANDHSAVGSIGIAVNKLMDRKVIRAAQ